MIPLLQKLSVMFFVALIFHSCAISIKATSTKKNKPTTSEKPKPKSKKGAIKPY